MEIPKIGMRNIKTAVAVLVCFLVFLPFWQSVGAVADVRIGPFYACIAAIICMQGSVEQSVSMGLSRVIGTLIGGGMGILVLLVDDLFDVALVTGLILAAGVVLTIWLCNLIRRPAACSIGCVVLCVVLLNHSGADRYLYTVIRVAETLTGVVIAVVVNRLLPDNRDKP